MTQLRRIQNSSPSSAASKTQINQQQSDQRWNISIRHYIHQFAHGPNCVLALMISEWSFYVVPVTEGVFSGQSSFPHCQKNVLV